MVYYETAKHDLANAYDTFGQGSMGSAPRFYHRVAKMIPDGIDVDNLILAFQIALNDAARAGEDTFGFMTLIPQFIESCAPKEFSHEFRKKFNEIILGLSQEELPDEDYGCNEVEKDVIDISNKDRNAVLAALYNASTPYGMGFVEYNPMSWSKEMAKMYFEHYGEPNNEGGISFKYILGRPVNVYFIDNLVYVAAYNADNEQGLAQRAIATCPNISNKELKR